VPAVELPTLVPPVVSFALPAVVAFALPPALPLLEAPVPLPVLPVLLLVFPLGLLLPAGVLEQAPAIAVTTKPAAVIATLV
jgi:hypothetical protein